MASNKKIITIVLMGIIIIAFFLPWYKAEFGFFGTHTISGFSIITTTSDLTDLFGHSSDSQIIYLLYLYILIPVLAGITLLIGVLNGKSLLLVMLRITSIITVLLCFVPDILIALDPKSRGIVEILNMFVNSGKSFGFYLTVVAAIIAFIVSFIPNAQETNPFQTTIDQSINQGNGYAGNTQALNNNLNNQQQINAAINSSKEVLSYVLVELKGKEKEQLAYLGFGLIIIIGLIKQIIVDAGFTQYLGAIILIGLAILGYFKFPMILKNQEFNGEFYFFTKQINRLTGTLNCLNKVKESALTISWVTLALIALFTLISVTGSQLASLVSFIAVAADYFLFIVVVTMLGEGDLKNGANSIISLSVIALIKLMKDLFISTNYLNVYYGVKFLAFWTLGWYILLIARQIAINDLYNAEQNNNPTNHQDFEM